MGVSGNFLAVALPGLTKHSPSQNPVNFRSFYPITESSTVEKNDKCTCISDILLRILVVQNICLARGSSMVHFRFSFTNFVLDILIFSGFSFGTILENLLIENTQI